MKEITIRCDYCSIQLFYENDTLDKKDDFRTVYSTNTSISANSSTSNIEGHFCSFECFENSVKGLFFSSPVKEDVLKAMAESLGYELKRKLTTVTSQPAEVSTEQPVEKRQ